MGITLGDTRLYRCEGMINILGGYDRQRLLQALPREGVLVDYNKTPSPGRKLGHVTVAHRERDAVISELERLHDLLYGDDDSRDSGGMAA
jgi:5-(carboxyamino)imidazole ribonucleotide synthase